MHGNTNNEAKRKKAIDKGLPKLCFCLAIFRVQMKLGGIMRHRGKKDIIRFRQRAPKGMLENLTDL
jgi:hypothetical protein